MEDAVRLVCPECDTAHRVKSLILGRKYQCKKCGAGLVTMEPIALSCPDCGAITEPDRIDVSRQPHCRECPLSPALVPFSPSIDSNAFQSPAAAQGSPHGSEFEKQLEKLNSLSDAIADRLILLCENEVDPLVRCVEKTSRKLLELTAKFDADMQFRSGELMEKLMEKSSCLDASIADFSAKLDFTTVRALSENVRETGDLFLRHLDEAKANQTAEIAAEVRKALDGYRSDFNDTAVSSGLAMRIIKGMEEVFHARNEREDRLLTPLAKVSEELVTGQEDAALRLNRLSEGLSENWGRLEPLMSDIKAAAARTLAAPEPAVAAENIAGKVSEDVTRRIESRLSATIANSLAMQASQFINSIQDERLEEVVLRAAREAQRPLFREVAALGGRGVPIWLFGSVLFPLFAVLAYLFLPGEPAGMDGAPLPMDNREMETQIRVIRDTVRDMHDKAYAHVQNSATLEERVRILEQDLIARKRVIDEQKQYLAATAKTIEEFNDAIRKLTWQNQAYEAHLRRLGVNPDTVPNVHPPEDGHTQTGSAQ